MSATKRTFTELIAAENELIDRARAQRAIRKKTKPQDLSSRVVAEPKIRCSEAANGGGTDLKTPWVGSGVPDRVGMAFSGGGIRSATYNLGLMQGLNDLGLLPLIDYLSTVSGGGYIGSWWTAWRCRNNESAHIADPQIFPSKPRQPDLAEPEAIHHVRTFSNYLVPRLGVFEVEFWNGVVAVMNGTVPALCVATSLMSLTAWLYLVAAWLSLATPPAVSTAAVVGISLLVFAIGEAWWRWAAHNDGLPADRRPLMPVVIFSLLALAGITGMWLLTLHFSDALPMAPHADSPVAFFQEMPWDDWTRLVSLFWPGFVSLAVLILLIFLEFTRLLGHHSQRRTGLVDLALHRVLGRLGFLVLAWCVPGAIWCLAEVIRQRWDMILGTGGVGGIAASLFALLRSWLATTLQPGRRPGFGKELRALVPQVLAYIALVSAMLLVCIGIQLSFKHELLTTLTYALPIVVVIGALVWLDPVNCGLHAFYRDRLCRAYWRLESNVKRCPKQSSDRRSSWRRLARLEFAARQWHREGGQRLAVAAGLLRGQRAGCRPALQSLARRRHARCCRPWDFPLTIPGRMTRASRWDRPSPPRRPRSTRTWDRSRNNWAGRCSS